MKPRQPKLLFFTLFLFAALLNSPLRAEDAFKVCSDPLNPPFSAKDFSGYENKIAALLAEELDQKLVYTWFPNRMGFIRNTLNKKIKNSQDFKCDVIIGVPAGYDRALTTKPYYHSTYVLLIAKNRGWDDIQSPKQLALLPEDRKKQLRIAMFDRGPGTAWLQKNGLIGLGIPYQSMTGDNQNNTAMVIKKDLDAKKIDMVILWGPMAGYILSNSPKEAFNTFNLTSEPGLKFDFSMTMGVRYKDNARKEILNKLIDDKFDEIQEILKSYQIPLLPIPKQVFRDEDD